MVMRLASSSAVMVGVTKSFAGTLVVGITAGVLRRDIKRSINGSDGFFDGGSGAGAAIWRRLSVADLGGVMGGSDT